MEEKTVGKDNPAELPSKENSLAEREMSDTDARLAARLKQLIERPGISDKDRKLLERNLKRLLAASRAG
jgi:hypothetical protein